MVSSLFFDKMSNVYRFSCLSKTKKWTNIIIECFLSYGVFSQYVSFNLNLTKLRIVNKRLYSILTLTDSLFSLWHREHPIQWWPCPLAHAPGRERVADPAHADGWGRPTPAHHYALWSRQLCPDHRRLWGGVKGCPALEWPRGHWVNQVTGLCRRALAYHRHEARGNNFWSRTSFAGKNFFFLNQSIFSV